MLLRRLKEFADDLRFPVPPTLYSNKPVRYIIQLSSEGRLLSDTMIDTLDTASASTRRGGFMMAPNITRTSGIRPLLLADTGEYTLGIGKEGANPERLSQKHSAYAALVDECAFSTEAPSVGAVSEFLKSGISDLKITEDFDSGANITFSVDGIHPITDQSVQKFWVEAAARSETNILQCLICGEYKPAMSRIQKVVKGIPGGQSSGTSIISANSSVFESYGLKASHIAPTCADCGEKFTESINYLLSNEKTHVRFPAAKVIFWTRVETEYEWGQLLSNPGDDDVKAQFDALWTGQSSSELDDTAFYGATLSASGGRAVVRDWIDTTVGNVKTKLARWFQAQSIVNQYGEKPRPLGIFALAAATVREARDIPASVPRSLTMCALAGTPLPYGLLYQAVRRNRAEQDVSYGRAALIKLVFAVNREDTCTEGYMSRLEMESQEPAYLCGRLLFILEDAQKAAIPGINATIVDRYFGTASTAPAAVFSRLLRGAQPHLSKLQRDNTPAYHAIQNRLTEVLEKLPAFPKTLKLEEQGMFALGYYHQRAHQRATAREARERRLASEIETK